MSLLQRYQTHNIEKLLHDMERFSIGMDGWINNLVDMNQNDATYPPHNIVETGENSFLLEVALAGFNEVEISVFTENNKLFVNGTKDEGTSTGPPRKYVHRGIATRTFKRFWTIPDGIEVDDVSFANGLLSINLKKIVPENQKKKVWF